MDSKALSFFMAVTGLITSAASIASGQKGWSTTDIPAGAKADISEAALIIDTVFEAAKFNAGRMNDPGSPMSGKFGISGTVKVLALPEPADADAVGLDKANRLARVAVRKADGSLVAMAAMQEARDTSDGLTWLTIDRFAEPMVLAPGRYKTEFRIADEAFVSFDFEVKQKEVGGKQYIYADGPWNQYAMLTADAGKPDSTVNFSTYVNQVGDDEATYKVEVFEGDKRIAEGTTYASYATWEWEEISLSFVRETMGKSDNVKASDVAAWNGTYKFVLSRKEGFADVPFTPERVFELPIKDGKPEGFHLSKELGWKAAWMKIQHWMLAKQP